MSLAVVANGCTRESHAAMKADVERFFLSTTYAFKHDGAEFRNCNECFSSLTLAVFCEECGRVCHATDRMRCKDGKDRHAVCAFDATRRQLAGYGATGTATLAEVKADAT